MTADGDAAGLPDLDSVLLWTGEGLLEVTGAAATPVYAAEPHFGPLSQIRQLGPDRVVALALASPSDHLDYLGPPRSGRVFWYRPDSPTDCTVGGPATEWFPIADGTGVWRVLQRSGQPRGLDIDGDFEAQPIGWDGNALGPPLELTGGRRPRAALRDGRLAVEVNAPRNRPYPDHVKWRERTCKGGAVHDLVAFDPATGSWGEHICDWTSVQLAGTDGTALVGTGDPNMEVWPTEVIDLDTGGMIPPPTPELGLRAFTIYQTVYHGRMATARADAPRDLLVLPVTGGDEVTVSTAMPPVDTRSSGLLWVGDTLLFVEESGATARLAAWSARTARTARTATDLPRGARPIGAIPRTWPPTTASGFADTLTRPPQPDQAPATTESRWSRLRTRLTRPTPPPRAGNLIPPPPRPHPR